MKWYRQAADLLKVPEAMVSVGYLYLQGFGVKQDYAQAMEWYRKAEAAGDVAAKVALGLMYRDGTGVTRNLSRRH